MLVGAGVDRQQALLKKQEYSKNTITLDSTLVYPLDSVMASNDSEALGSNRKLRPTRIDFAQITSTMQPALQMYSLLHYQLSINKFRVKQCLILTDGSSLASQKTLVLAFLAI